MRQRLLSSLLIFPLLTILWFGNSWIFALLIGTVALLATREFYNLFDLRSKRLLLLGFLLTSLFIADAYFDDNLTEYIFITALFLPLVFLLLLFPKKEVLTPWIWMSIGIIYTGWMVGHYISLRSFDQGKEWVILVIFSTFACDTGAFLVGRTFGRHKMAPAISPKKTWEGAAGGFIAAPIAALTLFVFLDITIIDSLHAILIGLIIGFVAQIGDLFESWFKRKAGVKDSGNLIPGHGGILDRIDSLILTGLVVYYYASFIKKDWI